MRFNNLVLTGSFLFWSASALCLPRALVELIETQTPEFKSILGPSTPIQNQLVLERYANLLLTSPFSRDLKIDKTELREYLLAKFKPTLPTEDEQKKSKQIPKFSASIDAEIQNLIEKFNGEFRDGLLQLNFVCEKQIYELPFAIQAAGPVAFSMTLHGIRIPEEKLSPKSKNVCLNIFMLAKSQPADLESINAMNVACPVPPVRAGTCLLSVAEEIVAATGRTKVKLTDGSRVRCELNREVVSLWNLRLYQGKPGWYESKGYQALPDGFENRVKAARSYLLVDLEANVDAIKESTGGWAQDKSLLKKWTSQFKALQKEPTVAQFMAWLWEKDCAAYAQIDKMITLQAKDIKYGVVLPQIIAFEKKLQPI